MNLNANKTMNPALSLLIAFVMSAVTTYGNEVSIINVLPAVSGGDKDPFTKERTLSFYGIGIMEHNKSKLFWKLFGKKVNFDGFAKGGKDMILLVQFKDATFRRLQIRRSGSKLIYFERRGESTYLYHLPKECVKLIDESIITEHIQP